VSLSDSIDSSEEVDPSLGDPSSEYFLCLEDVWETRRDPVTGKIGKSLLGPPSEEGEGGGDIEKAIAKNTKQEGGKETQVGSRQGKAGRQEGR